MDDEQITISRSEYTALQQRIEYLESAAVSLIEIASRAHDSLRSIGALMAYDLEAIDTQWERDHIDDLDLGL